MTMLANVPTWRASASRITPSLLRLCLQRWPHNTHTLDGSIVESCDGAIDADSGALCLRIPYDSVHDTLNTLSRMRMTLRGLDVTIWGCVYDFMIQSNIRTWRAVETLSIRGRMSGNMNPIVSQLPPRIKTLRLFNTSYVLPQYTLSAVEIGYLDTLLNMHLEELVLTCQWEYCSECPVCAHASPDTHHYCIAQHISKCISRSTHPPRFISIAADEGGVVHAACHDRGIRVM